MKHHNFIRKANKKPKMFNISEYKIHCAIAQYLDLIIKRPSRWHTVEVSNHGSGKAAMINQAMDKKKGVRTGWPDIEIFWAFPDTISPTLCQMIFLEVKAPGGKLTERQEALHAELREDGYLVFVVYSQEDVEKILKQVGMI